MVDILDQLALRGDVRRTVAHPQLGLQGVEMGLQLPFVLQFRGLCNSSILTVLLHTLLGGEGEREIERQTKSGAGVSQDGKTKKEEEDKRRRRRISEGGGYQPEHLAVSSQMSGPPARA